MAVFTKRLILLLLMALGIGTVIGFGLYHLISAIQNPALMMLVAASGYIGILVVDLGLLLAFRKWLMAGLREDFRERASQAVAESRSLEEEGARFDVGYAASSREVDERVGRAVAEVASVT